MQQLTQNEQTLLNIIRQSTDIVKALEISIEIILKNI